MGLFQGHRWQLFVGILLLPLLRAVGMLELVRTQHLFLAYALFGILILCLLVALALGARLSHRLAAPLPPRPGEHQGTALGDEQESVTLNALAA